MYQNSIRRRGVILTFQGLKRLEDAVALAQEREKFSSRFTQAELSERAKLSIKTIKKIREGKIPTDEASVRALFNAFGLEKLESADYGQPEPSPSIPEAHPPSSNSSSDPKIDWGEKPDTALFFGRTSELATLNQWVQGDQCRLITLLGMGGIGKTSLAAKLTNQVYDRFDYVIWRSLREAPPLDEILVRLIQFLSDQQETEINLPTRLGERIIRLLHYLREHRCLVVLDNLESILQAETAGHYRDGYEGYGELIQRIGSTEHQSCLLLTSRECPRELAPLAGDQTPVRFWAVGSIDTEAGREILKTKGLAMDEADDQGQELIRRCSGNPQALHLVATAIQREFLGDVDDFLQEQVTAVEDVRSLLDQHLSRLAPLARSVLFWLAINREPVGLDELMEDLLPPVTKQEVRGALRGLSDRYLIETVGKQFTLQNVIMEFATDRLMRQVRGELETQEFDLFHTHALIQATAKDHVRETQIRLILSPVIAQINALNQQVTDSLETIRQCSSLANGYAAGNLINLMLQAKLKVLALNFSKLTLRQVFLKRMRLQSFNLSNTLFLKFSLTDTLDRVTSVAFSPDGQWLATGSTDDTIRLLDIRQRQYVQTFTAHKTAHKKLVSSVAFSPDGQWLATGSEDRTIRLWQVSTGECCQTLTGHTDPVMSVVFSPDGQWLATGSVDCTIRLWDIRQRQCIHTFSGHDNWVWSVAFSPDGQWLATGSKDRTIRLWQVNTGECCQTLTGHTDPVMSVAFSPDGQWLATGSEDRTIRLWQVSTGECLQTLTGHTNQVTSVAFSSDGQWLATGSADCTIRLWDICQRQCIHTFSGHDNWVWSVAFSPDGQRLATGSDDCTIRLWSIHQRQCIHTFAGRTDWVSSVTCSSDGQWLAIGRDDCTIWLWNMQQRQCLHSFEAYTDRVVSMAFSPDGQWLATGSEDGTILLWDIRQRQSFTVGKCLTSWSMTFSPDGQWLATGSGDGTIQLWNIRQRQCIHTFTGHAGWVWSVAFSPNGQWLASGSGDCTIWLWDIRQCQSICTFTGHTDWVRSVAFSPDGQWLASGSDDNTIRLWNIQTKECIKVFTGHNSSVRSVTFSPDRKTLATGSNDNTIRLWNIQTKECIKVFSGHNSSVRSVTFSPDGKTLVTGSNDDTIRLWDTQSRECLEVSHIPRPYEDTDITGAEGLTEAQRTSMLALGAIDSFADALTVPDHKLAIL